MASECKGCGTCCMFVEMKMGKTAFDKQWIDFLTKTRPNDFLFSNKNKTLKIINPCVHLDQKTNKCTIYETRPIKCREYQCKKAVL